MRASFSIMNLPASAACQLVPQATILHLAEIPGTRLGEISISSRKMRPGFLSHAAQRGVPHGARLLEDFLEHEMLVAALFRHDRVPQNVRDLALHRPAVEIA